MQFAPHNVRAAAANPGSSLVFNVKEIYISIGEQCNRVNFVFLDYFKRMRNNRKFRVGARLVVLPLRIRESVLERVPDKGCRLMDIETLHDIRPVRIDRVETQ